MVRERLSISSPTSSPGARRGQPAQEAYKVMGIKGGLQGESSPQYVEGTHCKSSSLEGQHVCSFVPRETERPAWPFFPLEDEVVWLCVARYRRNSHPPIPGRRVLPYRPPLPPSRTLGWAWGAGMEEELPTWALGRAAVGGALLPPSGHWGQSQVEPRQGRNQRGGCWACPTSMEDNGLQRPLRLFSCIIPSGTRPG